MVCGRMGANTIMSDYHPVVIQNALSNITHNRLDANVTCIKLDWRLFDDCDMNDKIEDKNTIVHPPVPVTGERDGPDGILKRIEWKMIIAADCIFDLMHSRLVPKVAKFYLSSDPSSRFHVLLPHRQKFRKEIQSFEANMTNEGWILEYSEWIEKQTITFRYYIFSNKKN